MSLPHLINRLPHRPVLAQINLPALLAKLRRLLRHAGFGLGDHIGCPRRAKLVADLARDLHRAEFRSAHGAEMGDLVGVLGQGLVVEIAGGFRV